MHYISDYDRESTALASIQSAAMFIPVAERDTNEEAVRQVEKITDSAPVSGEDLVDSEDLKRKFREAKERLDSELP